MMNSFKPSFAASFFLLVFLSFSHSIGHNVVGCPKIEKQALQNFKQSLEDSSNLSSSWIGEVNCCKWEGVVCNNLTGHVEELRLGSRDLSGKLNSSLLNLTRLKHLDLSQNNFKGTIPSFIGLFQRLKYLDLSYAGFHGTIPCTIGNLSNLHTLNLASYSSQHATDNLEWLSSLFHLELLIMDFVDLGKATDWLQVINKLPSLVELSFSSCRLDFTAPLNDANITTTLTFLNLSGNMEFVVPSWVFQISSLIFLDLSNNNFQGSIPRISNTTNLRFLRLSSNNFNSIPDWLYFCKDLEYVSFYNNSLHGEISNAIANLTSLLFLNLNANELTGKIPREIGLLSKLQDLRLGNNFLRGEVTDSIGNMSNLQNLNLRGNQLSGAIPTNLGKLLSLSGIRLDDNKLIGNLPESLGQLFNLEVFYFKDNMLEGVVTDIHFANLTKLNVISASRNHLTLKVNPNWVPPFKLETLYLGSWNLGEGTLIPSWIQMQKYSITKLDLSNTGISGTVPTWFWKLDVLDLSHNQLYGKIPNILPTFLFLSSNRFNGTLPPVAATVIASDLSNNSFSGGMSHFLCNMANVTSSMQILHLGDNQLSGELPDCLMNWGSLKMLNLGNNKISGSIPNSLGFLQHLETLNLSGNKIFGQIPLSILNCTNLERIDLSLNELHGNIPTGMGTSLAKLTILILRSNKLSGEISSNICHLNALQILDLSSNNFFGVIPRCVNNFTAMATKRSSNLSDRKEISDHLLPWRFTESAFISTKGREFIYNKTLDLVINIDLSENNFSGDIPTEFTSLTELRSFNLSGNHLTGLIPDRIGDMKQLESLDLSRNSLFGEIPNSFTIMTFLNYLNLSHNNLSGRIPESTQLCGLDPSGFMGNNLYGPPLTSNCSYDYDRVPRPTNKDDKEGGKSKIEWFDVFLSSGYAVGVSAVCAVLVLKKLWRDAYFRFLEEVWDKIYVFSCLNWTRVMRAWRPSP